jgi:hypothetical protein
MNGTLKVGRITVAVSLVAFGTGLLLDNIGLYTGALSWVARLWPLMLIGFGVEYLVFTALGARSEQPRRFRFDIGGAFLLAFIVLISVGVTAFQSINWPEGIRLNLPIGPQASVSGGQTVALQQAREVVADLSVGTIALQPSVREGEVRIAYTYTASGLTVSADAEELLSQIKLSVENTGETLRINLADVPRNLNNVSLHYTLYVPAGLKVKLQTGAGRIEATGYSGTMDLTSNVGRIEVRAGEGALTAASGSGQIQVREFQGPVNAKTNIGSLEMDDVNGALQLDSGTGSIVVRDFRGGQLVAETRTGRIEASTGNPLEGNVSLKTNTGSVVLNAPEKSSMRATAQTRTGGLTVPPFMSLTRSGTGASAVGTSGDGKYTVSLEAGTGSVNFSLR